MDAIELLTTTKAVRRRIDFDRAVPFETLEECVRIAVHDQMSRMPALVIVGVKGRYESQPQIMQASAYGSILPAAWSFMLAARTKGLGATWTTLHLANADKVTELLDLPEDFTQAVMLAVGFYRGETFKPAQRLPVSSYIHRNGW
jgi:nitroreductase